MHEIIDLRSDTVTRPSKAMREAMLDAAVGDVVYNEDPTVLKLEATVARLLGKEAALYVPTGTMANTLAIRLCSEAGDEIIIEKDAHPLHYEAGGSGTFSGVLFKPVAGKAGVMDPAAVEAAIYEPVYYRARQRAILVENTHNRGGGTVVPLETLKAISAVARRHNMRTHMDGARLWNAAAASGHSMAEFAAPFNTVSVCFSKGMGAPVGSALVGSAEDIERAWHYRHMLGGSWRQAGILAAGALFAMDNNFHRLTEDHGNAKKLAQGLQERCGLSVLNDVETNMLYFETERANELVSALSQNGILMSVVRPGVVRCVTHLDVDSDDIEKTLTTIQAMQ